MLISISDLITASWELYKKHWRYLLTYMLLLFIPTLIMMVLGVGSMYLNDMAPASTVITNIVIIVLLIVSILFNVWASLALMRALKALYTDQIEIPWKDTFHTTSTLIWPFFYTSLLAGIIVVGGTLLFIIPGIIFAIWYAFVGLTVVLDEKRGWSALVASKQLVSGRWWSIFIRLLVPNILFAIITFGITFLLMLPIEALFQDSAATEVGGNVISAIISSLITPLTVAILVILYQSAKANPAQQNATQASMPPQA